MRDNSAGQMSWVIRTRNNYQIVTSNREDRFARKVNRYVPVFSAGLGSEICTNSIEFLMGHLSPTTACELGTLHIAGLTPHCPLDC